MRPARLLSISFTAVALAACTPRQVIAPPPPPPPPPAATAEELDAARTARARELWTQGAASGRQGRWMDAERAYREAVSLRPDSAVYQMALASALIEQRRDSEAANVLLSAIRVEEAEQPVNHKLLIVDYERLIQVLERVGRLDAARQARERQRFHRTMWDAAEPR